MIQVIGLFMDTTRDAILWWLLNQRAQILDQRLSVTQPLIGADSADRR